MPSALYPRDCHGQWHHWNSLVLQMNERALSCILTLLLQLSLRLYSLTSGCGRVGILIPELSAFPIEPRSCRLSVPLPVPLPLRAATKATLPPTSSKTKVRLLNQPLLTRRQSLIFLQPPLQHCMSLATRPPSKAHPQFSTRTAACPLRVGQPRPALRPSGHHANSPHRRRPLAEIRSCSGPPFVSIHRRSQTRLRRRRRESRRLE